MSVAPQEQNCWRKNALTRACANLKRLLREEEGVTAIEYGLLALLIVVAASGAIVLLGGGVNGMWTNIAAQVVAALGGR